MSECVQKLQSRSSDPSTLVLVLMTIGACGRVNFDPVGTEDGSLIDGPRSDGRLGDGIAMACMQGTDASCASAGTLLTTSSNGSSGNTLDLFADGTQGPCGGAGFGDYGVQFTVSQSATYEFSVMGTFDTLIYAIDGTACSGPSLGCTNIPGASGETLTLSLNAGQQLVVIADSNAGCGPVTLFYRAL